MKGSDVILFIPGLWSLLRHAGDDVLTNMPALKRLLCRCDDSRDSTLEAENRVLAELGWKHAAARDAPVAALERFATGKQDSNFWMCADPVNLVADRQYLLMGHPHGLALQLQEARQLAMQINSHFGSVGWQLELASTDCWYLRLDSAADIRTTPTWRVIGRDVDAFMPQGAQAMQWHAWLNELQMLMYNDQVNDQRSREDRPLVSSLWVWGGGSLPELSPGTAVTLWANTAFMQGLAKRAKTDIHALPQELSGIRAGDPGTRHLVFLHQARRALQSGSLEAGHAVLQQLEQQFLDPALCMLQRKSIKSLQLSDTPGTEICVSASGVRKWWRRRQPLPLQQN